MDYPVQKSKNNGKKELGEERYRILREKEQNGFTQELIIYITNKVRIVVALVQNLYLKVIPKFDTWLAPHLMIQSAGKIYVLINSWNDARTEIVCQLAVIWDTFLTMVLR
jgi:hypothetical protein